MLDLANPAHGFCVCFIVLLLMWISAEFGQRSEPPWWIAGPLVITLLLSIIGLIASLFMMVAERI
jgi:hypothetical protein